jgi:putative flippase GtrA
MQRTGAADGPACTAGALELFDDKAELRAGIARASPRPPDAAPPRPRRPAPSPPRGNALRARCRGALAELRRFARSSLMGMLASAVDFGTLVLCARLLGIDPLWSKALALLLGSATQFVGSRHFAFRARSGQLHRQLKLYVAAEVCATLLTLVVFRVMMRTLHMPLELANLVTGPIVHIGFSYPVWKRIFATPQNAPTPAAPVHAPVQRERGLRARGAEAPSPVVQRRTSHARFERETPRRERTLTDAPHAPAVAVLASGSVA